MMTSWSTLFGAAVLCCCCANVQGFPTRTPRSLCHDPSQMPSAAPRHHGVTAQTSPSPYTVNASSASYEMGTAITVTIAAESEGTPDFKGFMVTARDAHDRIVGTIASNDSLHTVFCWGAGLSHNSDDGKSSAMFTWTPAADTAGTIKFRATFVQTKTMFWAGVESSEVTDSSGAMATPLAATTPVIVDSAVTVNLSSCGDTKGCFRQPSNCTGADDCTAVVTWTPRTDDTQTYIEFELQGRDNWVALGLSADTLMGDDYVLVCRPRDTGASAVSALTYGYATVFFREWDFGLSERRGSVVDGVIRCVARRKITDASNAHFLALDQAHYLFLASGPNSGRYFIPKHTETPLVSGIPIDVTSHALEVDENTTMAPPSESPEDESDSSAAPLVIASSYMTSLCSLIIITVTSFRIVAC